MTARKVARRAVLYGRVSKLARGERERARQQQRGEGKSVDQQLTELRRIADRENVEVVGVFRDDGISASRYGNGKAREGWRDVMAAVLDGQVDELWVWEISRATRDRPVWASLINVCIAQGARITVAGKVHDPADPDDGFMLDLLAALAVRESAMTSKRIMRNVRAAAAEGKPHGRIAYGYAREYDVHTRELLRQYPDPETGPICAEIIRRVGAREPGYAIAGDLNRRGVPSPHEARMARLGQDVDIPYPWTLEQVHRIARNPVYAALRVHRGEVVGPGAWDPIVSLEEHRRAADVLDDAARRPVRDLAVKHLLSGIARCGVCGAGTCPRCGEYRERRCEPCGWTIPGAQCRVIKNRGYLAYACWGGPAKRGTCCVTRRETYVDDRVAQVICARMERPDAVARLAETVDDSGAAQAARELAELETRLAGFEAAAAEGQVSPAALGRIEAQLVPRIEDARRRAVPAQVPEEVLRLAGPGAMERWEAMTVPERRRAVRFLVEVIIHKAQVRGARTFRPELIEIRWR